MTDPQPQADEAPVEVQHEVARLVTWSSKDFTWDCTCGHRNVEKMPKEGIGEAHPSDCQAKAG